MPTSEKSRHHRHEARARRRRARRPAGLSPDRQLGPSAERGFEKQTAFFAGLAEETAAHAKVRAADRAERLKRRDYVQSTPAPPRKERHGGGKRTSRARQERRRWLREYRRKLWPRMSEPQRSFQETTWFGEPATLERRERWPVPRRRLVPLKLVREVAEANVGIRKMRSEAGQLAKEQAPKGLARLWRRMRGKQLVDPTSITPEAAAAVERLYGRGEAQQIAQEMSRRALDDQARSRRPLAKRIFRRGKV